MAATDGSLEHTIAASLNAIYDYSESHPGVLTAAMTDEAVIDAEGVQAMPLLVRWGHDWALHLQRSMDNGSRGADLRCRYHRAGDPGRDPPGRERRLSFRPQAAGFGRQSHAISGPGAQALRRRIDTAPHLTNYQLKEGAARTVRPWRIVDDKARLDARRNSGRSCLCAGRTSKRAIACMAASTQTAIMSRRGHSIAGPRSGPGATR